MSTPIQHHISSYTNPIEANIKIPQNHNRISVLNASLPKTYYVIQDSSNTFLLDSTEYTVPVGNYSSSELITAINSLTTGVASFSLSTLTNLVTITSTVSDTIQCTASVARCLGLEKDTEYSFSDNIVTSIRPINFQQVLEVAILCDLAIDTSAANPANMLGKIPMSDQYYSNIINYVNPNPEMSSKALVNNPVKYVTLTLQNEDEETINFNNSEIRLTLVSYEDINTKQFLRINRYLDYKFYKDNLKSKKEEFQQL